LRFKILKKEMTEFNIQTINDLPKAVDWLLTQANGRRKIMLYGQMGAGKTTFTKAFCQHLGVENTTSSPTFSLINEYFYKNTEGSPSKMYHADLYRLRNIEEALDIGIEDYLDDPNYCLIEWAEIIEPLLPEDVLKVQFEIGENSARKIVILP
jgi:tRNA threonylcarbamoyladenosine biosynthesis protein TsaE